MKSLATARRVTIPSFDLSESPVWDARNRCWVFVDINAGTSHKFDYLHGEVSLLTDLSDSSPSPAWKHMCALIPREQGGYVAIGTQGIAVTDNKGTIDFGSYVQLQTDPRIRFNDVQSIGGRLLGGTIDCAKFADSIAAFGEITPGGFKVIEGQHVISNGLAVSPDGMTLFHIESTVPFIAKFDRDPTTGELTNYRPSFGIIDGLNFFKDRDHKGAPKALGDGMAAAMYNGTFVLCVAEWGLSRIGIYDPATKKMIAQIDVPVSRPTSLSFGGDDYRTILITSERIGHDPADNCGLFLANVEGLTGFAPTPVNWL